MVQSTLEVVAYLIETLFHIPTDISYFRTYRQEAANQPDFQPAPETSELHGAGAEGAENEMLNCFRRYNARLPL